MSPEEKAPSPTVMMTTDPPLRDPVLEREITLLGDVILAAALAAEHLSDEQVDTALGLGDGDASPT